MPPDAAAEIVVPPLDLTRPRRIHIVGIGGVGMSAIALLLARMGSYRTADAAGLALLLGLVCLMLVVVADWLGREAKA